MFQVSPNAYISPLADIERSRKGSLMEISGGVFIDSFVKIKAAGGSGDLFIGENVYINSGTCIYTGNGVYIGENTLIAANCTLAPTNHEFSDKAVPIRLQGFRPSRGGIVIGSDVWIGAGAVILDGAVVGDGCVIGAGSLVRGELEPMGVYGGAPLRKIGVRGD